MNSFNFAPMWYILSFYHGNFKTETETDTDDISRSTGKYNSAAATYKSTSVICTWVTTNSSVHFANYNFLIFMKKLCL